MDKRRKERGGCRRYRVTARYQGRTASTTEADSVGQLLPQNEIQNQADRLGLVLVDKGISKNRVQTINAGRRYEVRRYD